MKKYYHLISLSTLSIILLDQISKFVVIHTIRPYESIPVIRGFFHLVHVRNRGIAFGLMNRSDVDALVYFLIAATLAAIVLLLYWISKLKNEDRRLTPGLSFILGGAVGNLIDRLRLREVIDFIDLFIGPYHWPAFNIADSAITIGVIWVAACMLFLDSSKNS